VQEQEEEERKRGRRKEGIGADKGVMLTAGSTTGSTY